MIITVPFTFNRDDERALAAELGQEMDVNYLGVVEMHAFIKRVVRENLDNLKEVHGIGAPKIKIKIRRRSR